MSIADAIKAYKAAHWGFPPDKIGKVYHPAAGRALVEMGWLVEVECRTPSAKYTIPFYDGDKIERGWVAFDPGKSRRLFLLCSREAGRAIARDAADADAPVCSLHDLCAQAPGRQNKYLPTDRLVRDLGTFWAVTYATHKNGDPPAMYRHRMGEHGGVSPRLAVDDDGYLYVCGGTYSVEPRGIVK